MHHPTDRITHTTAFVTPVVEHWLEREIARIFTMNISYSAADNHNNWAHYEYNLKFWPVIVHNPLCVWGPQRGTGVNILLENGQYPHNSSYEALCLPWGATREVDDGILVVESWLMSATQYIAIDNTLLRPGVRVDGRSGMARPDQSAGHAKLKSKQPLFCLFLHRTNIVYHLYMLLLGRWLESVRWFIFLLPEYINHVSLAWLSGGYPQQHVPLLDSLVGGGMDDEFKDNLICQTKIQKTNNPDGTRKRVRTEVSVSSTSDKESKSNSSNILTDNWPRFLIIEPVSEGAVNSLSPFAIHKAIQGLAGELKSVKRIFKKWSFACWMSETTSF